MAATTLTIRHIQRKVLPLRTLTVLYSNRSFASFEANSSTDKSTDESAPPKRGFLSLLFGGKAGKRDMPHSKLLTDSKRIYELQCMLPTCR